MEIDLNYTFLVLPAVFKVQFSLRSLGYCFKRPFLILSLVSAVTWVIHAFLLKAVSVLFLMYLPAAMLLVLSFKASSSSSAFFSVSEIASISGITRSWTNVSPWKTSHFLKQRFEIKFKHTLYEIKFEIKFKHTLTCRHVFEA